MCYVAALIAADSRSLAQKLLRQTFTIPTYIYIYVYVCVQAFLSGALTLTGPLIPPHIPQIRGRC